MRKNNLDLALPQYWPAWAALGTVWLITRLPFRWQTIIGKNLGKLLYIFPTKLKRITEINIKLCFPEYSKKQRNTIIKKNFAELGAGLIDSFTALWLPDKVLKPHFTIHGSEHIAAGFAKGKGILFVGPHFSGIESMGRLVGMILPLVGMYRPHKKRFISYLQDQYRRNNGTKYLARNQLREVLKCLNANMAVGYAYDIDGGRTRSVFAPFFGIPTASLTALSRLAASSGATVIPAYYYRREKQFGYDIYFLPPLENFPSGDHEKDATLLNSFLEKAIRNRPEQYMWQYKRFKTRPLGEERFY